ncbi:MAG: hypothetical protein GFGODING_02740 [Flavobacteriales bacterium]|nr:hypothetical protein [Flavobacteriales bacterium]
MMSSVFPYRVVSSLGCLCQAQCIHQFPILPAAHLDIHPVAHCHDAAFAFDKMLYAH